MLGLGVKRIPNQLRQEAEGEPEVFPPTPAPAGKRTQPKQKGADSPPKGTSPALAACVSQALRRRLPLKKTTQMTATMTSPNSNRNQLQRRGEDA